MYAYVYEWIILIIWLTMHNVRSTRNLLIVTHIITYQTLKWRVNSYFRFELLLEYSLLI